MFFFSRFYCVFTGFCPLIENVHIFDVFIPFSFWVDISLGIPEILHGKHFFEIYFSMKPEHFVKETVFDSPIKVLSNFLLY